MMFSNNQPTGKVLLKVRGSGGNQFGGQNQYGGQGQQWGGQQGQGNTGNVNPFMNAADTLAHQGQNNPNPGWN